MTYWISALCHRFCLRKLTLFVSLVIATIAVNVLLRNYLSFSDSLPVASLFFSVVLGLWQWLEDRQDRNQRSLEELEDRFNYLIQELRRESQTFDDSIRKDFNLTTQKLEGLSVMFTNHIQSIGHTETVKNITDIKESLVYTQTLVNVHTEYAQLKMAVKRIEEFLHRHG